MGLPLLLADVPWLLYRAHFALPSSIRGADGEPVGALLGTVNALLAAIAARPPRAVVCCFGQEDAAYRKALFPEYHAQRPPMPPELAHRWTQAPELMGAFGWRVETSEDLEADDLLYSLAVAEAREGGSALILTGDRDLYQAVGPSISILEMKGTAPPVEVGPLEVRRRYGIAPDVVPDFIALRGDPSDNIPGAPGIGEKTARDLLLDHGSLEDAIVGALRERPRVCAALRENADRLRMFRRLATLVEVDLPRVADAPTDLRAGADAVERLGMGRLAARLRREAGQASGPPARA